MSNTAELSAAFETVLQSAFGLDPVASREGDGWWRFEVGGVKFNGGIHTAEVRVFAVICGVDTDADLDTLYGQLGAVPRFGLAQIVEQDSYLQVKAALPFASASRASIEQAIRDCITAVESPEARSLKSRWQA